MNLSNGKKTSQGDLELLLLHRSERPDPKILTGTRGVVFMEISLLPRKKDQPFRRKMTLVQGCTVSNARSRSTYSSRLALHTRGKPDPEMNWTIDAEHYLGEAEHVLVLHNQDTTWDVESEHFVYHSGIHLVGRSCCDDGGGRILVFTAQTLPAWIQLVAGGVFYTVYWADAPFPKVAGRSFRLAKRVFFDRDDVPNDDVKVILGGEDPRIGYIDDRSEGSVLGCQNLIQYREDAETLLRKSLVNSRHRDSLLFLVSDASNPFYLVTKESEGLIQIGQEFSIPEFADEPKSRRLVLVSSKLQEIVLVDRNKQTYIVRDIHSDDPKVEVQN